MKMYAIDESRLKILIGKECICNQLDLNDMFKLAGQVRDDELHRLLDGYIEIDYNDLNKNATEWKVLKAMFPRECEDLIRKYREKIREVMDG